MGDDSQAVISERERAAAENRRRMPHTTALFDSVRKVFPGAKVQWAREGGIEVGRKSADDGHGAPACCGSPTMDKFLAVLRKEFLHKYGKPGRTGDADWGIYVSEQGALRWDDFCGRTFD